VRFLPQVWGVQFHPEFSPEVLTDLAGEHPDVLRESGRDPVQVAVETSQWREETGVISRFARLQTEAARSSSDFVLCAPTKRRPPFV
jgi:GMP synthase (glutamine-hydrolysing)